jgi:hypothetical protein
MARPVSEPSYLIEHLPESKVREICNPATFHDFPSKLKNAKVSRSRDPQPKPKSDPRFPEK